MWWQMESIDLLVFWLLVCSSLHFVWIAHLWNRKEEIRCASHQLCLNQQKKKERKKNNATKQGQFWFSKLRSFYMCLNACSSLKVLKWSLFPFLKLLYLQTSFHFISYRTSLLGRPLNSLTIQKRFCSTFHICLSQCSLLSPNDYVLSREHA